jgi:hypothetical protein
MPGGGGPSDALDFSRLTDAELETFGRIVERVNQQLDCAALPSLAPPKEVS